MIRDALFKLSKLPSYTNKAIVEIQDRVQKELQNQKNMMANREKYSVAYTDKESYKVQRVKTETYTDTESRPIYQSNKFIGIPTGSYRIIGFENVDVKKERLVAYDDTETRDVTKYRDETKLKYSEDELLAKAKAKIA